MYLYIRSMSEVKHEIYRKIVDQSDMIVEHLMKILLFPNSEYIHHWQSEIYSFLPRVKKLRNTKKWPSKKFILEALSTNNDMLDTFIWQSIEEESELTPEYLDAEDALPYIEEYMDWLADQLSSHGGASPEGVRQKLEEIRQKRIASI